MVEDKDKESASRLEQEVWSAISAFEQILEAMPNDVASLEALSHACEQIGDHARARDYLVRLGNVLVAEGDFQTARQLLEKLAHYAKNDDRARELTARIEQQAGEIPSADEPRAAGGATATVVRPPERAAFSMADELSFAWNLMEAKELTQDEYAAVVHDLAEMSATDNSTTISILHALEFRTSKNLERIMVFLAGRCGMPIVALSSFGLSVETMTALPMDFMVRRGALVFGFIGPEALVVVMNPYNETLRKDIGAALGRKCHFFLAVPSDFDQTVGRIKNQLQEKSSSENQG